MSPSGARQKVAYAGEVSTPQNEAGAASGGRIGRLASLTKYIPHASIAHAGGQYAWAHYLALAADWRIRAIAPLNEPNRAAQEAAGATPPSRLVRGRGFFGDGRMKLIGDLESAWSGSAIPWFIRALARRPTAALAAELEAADVIEFQWSEMMALAPILRDRFPRTPFVGIAHDVITQRWERAAEKAPDPARRLVYRVAAARSRARERRSFAALDLLIAFSDKDAALAAELAPGLRVEVVHPGLGPLQPVVRAEDPEHPAVLFTGALNRPDNSRAVEWFLDEIWPQVRREVPAARFVIAGANPPASLVRAVDRADGAALTGFVDSLEPYYAQASVFVAPLLTGAGVKFKTLDAMLRGAPVVSTSVGAEGIEAPELFQEIVDDADGFARAVIRTLRDPDRDRAARAAAWTESVYGVSAFRERLTQVYRDLRG